MAPRRSGSEGVRTADSFRRRYGLPLAIGAFAGLTVVAAWIGVGLQVAAERERSQSAARERAAAAAHVFAEHTESVIAAADRLTRTFKYLHEAGQRGVDLAALFVSIADRTDFILQVHVTDRDGRLTGLNSLGLTTPIDLSDREYIRVHVERDGGDVYLSRPALDRASGRWSVQATRRINRPDGSFDGVVTVSVDPHYFARFYQTLALGPDSDAALFGLDGAIRARKPDYAGALSFALPPDDHLMRRVAAEQTGTYRRASRLDGIERIYAFRRLAGYPLFVVVGQAHRVATAPFERYARDALAGLVGATLLVALLSALLIRFAVRQAADRQQLAEAKRAAEAAIDEQRWAQLALGDSEQRLRTIIETEPECVKLVAPGGQLLEMNPAGLAMLEAESLAAVQERTLLGFLLPEHRAAFVALHRRVMAGDSGTLEFEVEGLRGTRRWLHTHAVPMLDANGAATALLGITRDVTERKRLEQQSEVELRALEALAAGGPLPALLDRLARCFETTYPHMRCSVLLLDPDRKTLRHGAAPSLPAEYCRAVDGIEIGPQVGSCGTAIYTGKTTIVADIATDPLWRDYKELALAHGLRACWSVPIRTPQGRVEGAFALYYDRPREARPDELAAVERGAYLAGLAIERSRTEEQLRAAHRMEAVGQLTGGMAHDFNNLLAVVTGNLELLAEKLPGDRVLGDHAATALRAARRGADLTHRLLAFGRRQALDPRPIDLRDAAREVEALLLRTLPASVSIAVDAGPAPVVAAVDAAQLENALVNLALNARDAMPAGGRLRLAVETLNVAADDVRRPDAVPAGRYATIAAHDTGVGMPPDVAARSFEPFFTTKAVGHGTGLGLSMVYGFVRQSGGYVQLDSRPAAGTTVRLLFPAHDGPPAVEPAAAPRDRAEIPDKCRVLVVEDRTDVRRTVAQMLESLRFAVVTAPDAESALSELARDRTIDAMLADLGISGAMGGTELVARAAAAAPGLRIATMSGYAEGAEAADAPGRPHLVKPFPRDALAAAMRALFVRGEAGR